ncbi:Mitogen-activated protein kinase kinase kinase 3 [Lathyrus oleraceus]|uniref:Mitogen-activated protein kinase kinase kinase 3 n=1 Tax=Pisum sativum TaxID=3888 RepID=A0A9D5AXE3_PEA|nr:Mitogen-activated protein kinase kinase kinase 3 [Pisum sativum]
MQAIFGSVRRSLVFRTASPETEDQSLRVGETLVDKTVTASVILDLKRGNWKWNYYWNYPNIILLREYIGKVKGYILLLVTISSSEHNQAAKDAIELLEKFSYFDQNVIQIGYCIRNSRVLSKPSPSSPPIPKDIVPQIRWRKGDLIDCGTFGHVYVGMNLDSGELLAVKQVLISASSASKEKARAHVKKLEEEVKLLKDLSHPNIVRYLAFPGAVIRTYTKQILLGLEDLHKNGIMHKDIKGANILVDNKGCIKLADFGASKQVVELATMSGAKSMTGTPY